MKTQYEQFKHDVHTIISSKNETDIILVNIIKKCYLNSIDCMIAWHKSIDVVQERDDYEQGFMEAHYVHSVKYLKEQRKLIEDHE